MKLTINTTQFQDLVAKAIKGSSNDKILPITTFMEIKVEHDKLTLTTTDATNYFSISTKVETPEEFTVVVLAESFAKLISKMTCENLTLNFEGSSLSVTGGRSNYQIELQLDVDGTLVKLSTPDTTEVMVIQPEYLSAIDIESILASAKSALATELTAPCYTAYYVGDKVMSTDSIKLCCIDRTLVDTPVLISSATMDLLGLMIADGASEIKYYRLGDNLVFVTDTCVLCSKAFDGIENYQVQALNSAINTDFPSKCSVKKNDLLQALDRLSIFVGQYDNNVVNISFTEAGLVLSNKKDACVETIEYIKNEGTEFSCRIKVELFISQIKAIALDEITILYGSTNFIMLNNGDIVHIVSLYED